MEVVFIAHDTAAHEVDEDHFFNKGESGGTFISSGYAKALEIIQERYSPSLWNIYVLHASDGDNFTSDNDKAVDYINQLTEICNLIGYTEILPHNGYTLSAELANKVKSKKFVINIIKDKNDVWISLKRYLTPEYDIPA